MLFLSLFVVATLTFSFRFGKYHIYTKKRVNYVYQIENFESKNQNLVEVVGNTSHIPLNHPVIDIVLNRWISGSKPGKRWNQDNHKIALCIEGGGMRGCVAAGSAAAINFLGLNDAVDLVYGSSAGAMVGSYFVSRQFSGVNIYHDILPAAGSKFIDKRKLLAAMGFPLKLAISTKKIRQLLSPNTFKRIMNKINVIEKSNKIPEKVDDSVFNLNFLLNTVMNGVQRLDWDSFSRNERHQKLRIVTTSLHDMTPLVLSRENGNYHDTQSLLKCIRASMLVPGLTGDLMGLSKNMKTPFYLKERKTITEEFTCGEFVENYESIAVLSDGSSDKPTDLDFNKLFVAVNDWIEKKMSNSSDTNFNETISLSNASKDEITPLVDAFICEPIPYRSAAAEGCTHIITLRTRPDPCPVLGKKPGIYERLIARRFFRKYSAPLPVNFMLTRQHQFVYAEDVLIMNKAAQGPCEGVDVNGKHVHILPIACTPDAKEVGQLEMKRDVLLYGMRDGARRALQIFLPAMLEKNRNYYSQLPDTVVSVVNEEKDLHQIIETAVDNIFPLSMLNDPARLQDIEQMITDQVGGNNQT